MQQLCETVYCRNISHCIKLNPRLNAVYAVIESNKEKVLLESKERPHFERMISVPKADTESVQVPGMYM